MKKQLFTIAALIFEISFVFGQGGTPGNFRTGSPLQFLGYNALGVPGPLDIRNNFNSFININTGGPTLVRMRMHHLSFGAPLQQFGTLTNPLPGNRLTRIGISRDGANPLTKPLSLLHLGYNSPIPFTIGHRDWQDIGTMYSAESDNMYVGMRQKSAIDPTGRTSAVLTTP